jgi:dolichol kinase
MQSVARTPQTSPPDPSDPGPAPIARPFNLLRNVYHVANAVVVLLVVEYVLVTPGLRYLVAGAGFAAAWSMELSRRLSPAVNTALMRLFAPVAHPDEAHHVNSATWYTTAILLLAVFSPLSAGVVGLAVLGLADPAAAIVGRRWGRHRLADGRSLEGTLAFVAVGTLAAWLPLILWHGEVASKGWLALAAATGGALSELLSGRVAAMVGLSRIDDNLVIPLASAASMLTIRVWMGA